MKAPTQEAKLLADRFIGDGSHLFVHDGKGRGAYKRRDELAERESSTEETCFASTSPALEREVGSGRRLNDLSLAAHFFSTKELREL